MFLILFPSGADRQRSDGVQETCGRIQGAVRHPERGGQGDGQSVQA